MSNFLAAGGDELFKRLVLFNRNRDNQGLMVLDKDTEEYLQRLDAAHDAGPAAGASPGAHGEREPHSAGEVARHFAGGPQRFIRGRNRNVRRFDQRLSGGLLPAEPDASVAFRQLSLWGVVDPAITFAFVPLSDLTPKEKAEVEKLEAETDDIRINGGVLDPAETRKSIANNPDSRYPGIDPDAVPDLLEEEEEGLEPKGAAAGIAKEADGKEPDGDRDQNAEPNAEPERKAA